MKIAVGLSGGVDSSVAALLLKRAGYDVFALFMQNWHDTTGTLHGDCEWEEDMNVAKMVAKKIGIPFHFVDLSDTYRKRVVDYMFAEYEKGRTPNPDVMCNREIKFDAFLKAAQELGADYVATGHYCQKEAALGEDGTPLLNPDGSVVYRIIAGADGNKDQTYFLCQLSQNQLSKALFPIGGILKPEVRRIAAEAGLPSADKKDSQGICFVGKVDLPVFLQQKLAPKEGRVVEIFEDFYDTLPGYPGYGRRRKSIVHGSGLHTAGSEAGLHDAVPETELRNTLQGSNLHNTVTTAELHYVEPEANGLPTKEVSFPTGETHLYDLPETELDDRLAQLTDIYRYREQDGKVIGKHDGAHFYTIGQRKGLNIGGHKESIFIIETNIETNTIYVGEGHHHPGLLRKALKIANPEIHWIREDLRMKEGEHRDYLVRIRYRQPLQKATLYQRRDFLYIIFENHQRGISEGQFAVWHTPTLEMLGSGTIQ